MTMENYGRKACTTKYYQMRQWLCNTDIGLPDYVARAFLSNKNVFPDVPNRWKMGPDGGWLR